MALTRAKTWIADEILTASDLNAEFDNIITNAPTLISPTTAAFDMDGFELILDGDGDTSITADTDDVIHIRLLAKDQITITGTSGNEGNITATDTDAGAAAGPIWELYRNSATPADNDVLGQLLFTGEDDGGAKHNYAAIEATILDASAGTEDGGITFATLQNASLTDAFHIGLGLYAEGNTDPGAGKIDADDLLVSGASVITSLAGDTTPQLGGDLDANGNMIQWAKGADVASATALPLLTDGNYFDVTGTTTVTSFDTVGGDGTIAPVVKLHFDGALTLTHHATNLILPGGANITTAAGDEAEFVEYGAGTYRCTNYVKASGSTIKFPTADFTSAGQTVTVDTVLNVAHGLGSIPTLTFIVLRCTDAGGDIGYAQNDEILLGTAHSGGAGSDSGVTVHQDATNVTIVQGSSIALHNPSTLNLAAITTTKWEWEVRAWA